VTDGIGVRAFATTCRWYSARISACLV